MEISYLGHSCFRIKTGSQIVVTDPFDSSVGLPVPKTTADVVTLSHAHSDHNNLSAVSGTSRTQKPFVIDSPGEYEVGGISVFGVAGFHDDQQGEIRGDNTIFSILLESVSIVHLGDLGHALTSKQISELNGVDVLMCPIGGHYTMNMTAINEVISSLEPSILIPMHYRTDKHNQETFSKLLTLDEFLKQYGSNPSRVDKLIVSKSTLPEEMEIVVFNNQ